MTMWRGENFNHIKSQQILVRLIKLLKDRLRTVHREDRLQDVLVSVAALRKRCAGLKPSNFNSQELRAALRSVLNL